MDLSIVVSAVAVLLSPLIALQVSESLQRRRERRARRLNVFKTLMATRASALAPDHVQALNRIDIEFHGADAKSKAVLNAWKAYLDHLNSEQANLDLWLSRREDLLVDLLFEMSRHLNYDFDKTHIRRTSYFPRGYTEIEADQAAIRKGVATLMSGKASLPIFLAGANQLNPPGEASSPPPLAPPGDSSASPST